MYNSHGKQELHIKFRSEYPKEDNSLEMKTEMVERISEKQM
jgi:hypothetical protein